ncbi:MAG: hypothetical protein EZS28_014070 [Streblomastix strix]|uniref:Uncharacterized protein n=1 Tax=Streblomastix strix TaxID=222440 RepID=A0A5J4W796_9EUKA|nr:MAG: hypothetical protein EZS28_014070 [Streblomastix strix]
MKPGFIVSEVLVWFAGQYRTPKSSLNKQSCFKTVLKLIFDEELMQNTPPALTYSAISNCKDPQIKLASLLPSVWFWRITENSEDQHFHPKLPMHQNNTKREEQEYYTFVPILLSLHDGFCVNSIRHASTTKLAAMAIQERNLNIFMNRAQDSKSACNYYIFASIPQMNVTVARLVTIDYGLENQDSTSTKVSQLKKTNETPKGDIHALSPTGGDNMLSLCGFHFFFYLIQNELRFKLAYKRNRATKQLDQIQISNMNNLSISLHNSSHGSPLRKPKTKPGQSQKIKDPPCQFAKNQRK